MQNNQKFQNSNFHKQRGFICIMTKYVHFKELLDFTNSDVEFWKVCNEYYFPSLYLSTIPNIYGGMKANKKEDISS